MLPLCHTLGRPVRLLRCIHNASTVWALRERFEGRKSVRLPRRGPGGGGPNDSPGCQVTENKPPSMGPHKHIKAYTQATRH
jgi:hypothetical protein